MFNHLLVPLDGSSLAETALPHVVAMAQAYQSQVTLLHVLDPAKTTEQPAPVDPVEWQIKKAQAESYLRQIATSLQEVGLNVLAEVIEGKAAESVIEYAHDRQVDLVILSSHGQSGISGWNVSSVVQKIILRVRTSVMIVRAYKTPEDEPGKLHYRRILAPLDGSQRAEFVLPALASLGTAHQAEIVFAHVIRKPETPRRTLPSQEDVELVNQITERNRVEAELYLADLTTRLDVPVSNRLLVSDSVTSPLHLLVEQENVDLVVLSAHGYGGETRWPYGSIVISFIAYGTTPLLVLQDLPSDRIEATMAEMAARERGGR